MESYQNSQNHTILSTSNTRSHKQDPCFIEQLIQTKYTYVIFLMPLELKGSFGHFSKQYLQSLLILGQHEVDKRY